MENLENVKNEIIRISGVNPKKCMQCGKCSGTCPAFDQMEYHPHQFVSMLKSGNIEPLLKSESIYACLTCFACVDRCPRGVEPAKIIDAVRVIVQREQGKSRLKADGIAKYLDDDIPGQALVTAMRKYNK